MLQARGSAIYRNRVVRAIHAVNALRSWALAAGLWQRYSSNHRAVIDCESPDRMERPTAGRTHLDTAHCTCVAPRPSCLSLRTSFTLRRHRRCCSQGHVKGVIDIDFSPDGYTIATSSDDHTVGALGIALHRLSHGHHRAVRRCGPCLRCASRHQGRRRFAPIESP